MIVKSIRARLTLWYVLVFAVILILFCIFLFESIRYALNKQVNKTLIIQADYLADSYNNETNSFADLPEQDFQTSPLLWFRIVMADGKLYQPAPTFEIFNQPFPLTAARKLVNDEQLLSTFTLPDRKKFRSIIFPIDFGMERIGWVQLVKPITDVDRTLTMIINYMFILISFSILILAIGGSFLARKSLQPVESIRRQVDRIYGRNLSQRIKVINPDDELGQLAKTFNLMLDRLQMAFESQRRFLADASHELKIPITIIRSQWEKIAEIKDLPSELQLQVQTDIEELARLANLVNNLLLLSAVDDNRIKIEEKVVELDKVLKEVIEDGKILAESKKQKIIVDQLEPIQITGDQNRLFQLFLNLFDNAVKYTPAGEEIHLSLKKMDDKIVVEISDNGIGISSQNLPFLFDRFFRVDKSRSRQFGGSGLGLSICQWIVKAHGGEIKIDSELGKGTRVVVGFKPN